MADVIETDLTTDPPTITERDFTPEELAQREADAAAAIQAKTDRVASETAATAAIADAIAHAKTLGFTDAMIAVMYPTLTP
jgi:hypothetical protein